MILYYTFQNMPYTKYSGEGYVIGYDTYDEYEYDIIVEAKAEDVIEYLGISKRDETVSAINELIDKDLFYEDDPDFIEFMKNKYFNKAWKECEESLE